jgi:hypothetical protein
MRKRGANEMKGAKGKNYNVSKSFLWLVGGGGKKSKLAR